MSGVLGEEGGGGDHQVHLIHVSKHCSFLDDAFRKNLESALRFGNPLLVQVSSGLGHQSFDST